MRRHLLRLSAGILLAYIFWRIYKKIAPGLGDIAWNDVQQWWPPQLMPLLLSLLLLVAANVLHAFLWRRIAIDLGSPAPSTRATLHIYFVSSLGRYVPGKIWQFAGVAIIAARFGLAGGRAAAASVVAQIAFLGTGLLFLGATLPWWDTGSVRGSALASGHPVLAGLILFIATAAVVWLFTATAVGDRLRGWLVSRAGPRLGSKVGNALALVDEMTFRRTMIWAIGYALSWVLVGAAFALFVSSFVPDMMSHAVFLAGAFAAAYIWGYINFFIPAGLGVRELAMGGLVATVAPDAAAVLIAAVARVWTTAAELIPITFIPLAGKPPAENVVETEEVVR